MRDFVSVLAEIEQALKPCTRLDDAAREAMTLIAARLPAYRWVGVYWLSQDTLILGPYVGAPTDHTHIAVGRGVCGTAVAENRNMLVHDVRATKNYLACSLETRSEIVVLIRDPAGSIIGQIDADGHEVGDFTEADEAFLMRVAALLAEHVPLP